MRKILLLFVCLCLPTMAFSQLLGPPKIIFNKQKLQLGNKTITVEVADTEEKQAQGLMFRKKLDPDSGMIFIFNEDSPKGFWMKNTIIPLSIGYFDKNKKLIDIQEMLATNVTDADAKLKIYRSRGPAQYALEMDKGWFKKNKIKLGTSFKSIP